METWILALTVFLLTAILILWRPGGVHEAVPALVGAFGLFLLGFVDRPDVLRVLTVVWNAALTIIATFVMASVLEGTGFFRWVTDRIIDKAEGSGHRLFHLVLAFSALLTLFLNNDGAILLGTPVVLGLVQQLRLPPRGAFGFLVGACLIASAASPPLGVSNMANLEAMALMGISLSEHFHAIFLPALVGLGLCWGLLYLVFGRSIPDRLNFAPARSSLPPSPGPHPHAVRHHRYGPAHPPPIHHGPMRLGSDRSYQHLVCPDQSSGRFGQGYRWFAVGVVVAVRVGYFIASGAGVPAYLVATVGAAVLLLVNEGIRVINPRHALRRAPWPVLGFAFGMELVVFGLRNAGILTAVAAEIADTVLAGGLGAAFVPGGLVALMSALLNNHPGLISGSLMLNEIQGLAPPLLYTAYGSVILGSDLGALLTPIGTLAVLIWFHLLRQHGLSYSWEDYLRVTLVVIPISFLAALGALYALSVLAGG